MSSDQGTWVITSFAVANAISVPLTGWLTLRFGQVRLFMTSIVLFVIASWLCGMAPSLPILLAARVLQGAVAGPMVPLSQTLLLASYLRAKASMALSMWSMTTLIAPVAGPILGGWISDNIAWPWIFYVNIPVGFVAAVGTFAIFRERDSLIHKTPVDFVGLGLLVCWVGSLQIMLDKGKDLDWFNSPTIVVLLLTAVIALAFFLAWELTEDHPVVDLSLFKLRNFVGGAIVLAVGYGLYFGNLVLLPLWLQTNIGYTATNAGLVMAPVGVFAVLLSPVVGRLLPRVDARKVATFAFLVFALVFWMRSRYTTGVDAFSIRFPTLIQGIAMTVFFIPLASITLSSLPGTRIPASSGLSNFLRIMCGGIGTSIFSTAWDHRSALHHAQLVENATLYNPNFNAFMQQLCAIGLDKQQSYVFLNNVLTQQAAQLGVNDMFYISAWIFLFLIGLIWITGPEKPDNDEVTAAASAAH